MTPVSEHDAASERGAPRPRRIEMAAALRVLLAVVWIAGPPWTLWQAVITSAGFFGEQPSQEELLASGRYLHLGAAIALGVPLLGLLLAMAVGERGATWRWLAACVLGVLGAAFLLCLSLDYRPDPAPRPAPAPVHCQAYSGGDSNCPGG